MSSKEGIIPYQHGGVERSNLPKPEDIRRMVTRLPGVANFLERNVDLINLQASVLEQLMRQMQEYGFTIHTTRSDSTYAPYEVWASPIALRTKQGKSIQADLFVVLGDRAKDTNTASLIVSEDWPFGTNMRRAEYIVSRKTDGTPGTHPTGARYIFERGADIPSMTRIQTIHYLRDIASSQVDTEKIQKMFAEALHEKPREGETREVFWNTDQKGNVVRQLQSLF